MASEVQDRGWRASPFLRWFLPVAIFAVILRVVFAYYVIIPDRLLDDGYITLRYAGNLTEGRGFVYNQGQPVWGTTTPLFTLLLYLSASVFGVSALEHSALVIDIVASVIFWLCLWRIFEEQRVPRLASIPVFFVVMFSPAFFSNSLSGMETPVVLLLMALSLYAYTKDKALLLGVLFALLLMARIDTLIWIGILGGGFILRHYRTNPRSILVGVLTFVVLSLPWQIYAYVTFHSLIPQSLVGKAVSHGAFESVGRDYFVKYYQIYYPFGRLRSFDRAGVWAGIAAIWTGIAITLSLMLWGFWTVWRMTPLLRPLAVFFFCFSGAFYLAKAPEFAWYFPPAQWVAYFLLCMGLYGAWNTGLASARSHAVRLLPWGALVAFLTLQSGVGLRDFWRDRAQPNLFVALSQYITANSDKDSTIFVEHIGTVGFRSGRTIIDNMGLVSPEIADLKRKDPDGWLVDSLKTLKPDVVVLYTTQVPNYTPEDWAKDDPVWYERARSNIQVHPLPVPTWNKEDLAWFEREYRFEKRFETFPRTYVYFKVGPGKPQS